MNHATARGMGDGVCSPDRDATLPFFLLGRSDLGLFLVGHGSLCRLFRLADVLHVVRRRFDLARHEAINPLGP
jgi:hypothetical protein